MSLQELGLDHLSTAERLDLIGLLWDSIIDAGEAIVPPEWQLRELERRRAAAEANPQASEPWEVVKDRLLRKP